MLVLYSGFEDSPLIASLQAAFTAVAVQPNGLSSQPPADLFLIGPHQPEPIRAAQQSTLR